MNKVLVMGLGGAGIFIAGHIQKQLGCQVVAANTDSTALRMSSFERQLILGPTVYKGDSANTPARGRRAAEESRVELAQSLEGVDTLVLLAGLGGGTGTGAAPVVIALAKSLGIKIVMAVVLPFEFEKERRAIALGALAELQSEVVTVLVHDNADALNDLGKPNRSLLNVFEVSAKKIAEDVRVRLSCSSVGTSGG